ncbi:hypothetical protein [Candidatus Poriferisodalis sp.]|uniref:hypothetical protein n=1 Tax=Candidatus Poriferisodalis sp. TaxID=3101277 RepID=UPI003B5206D0
MALPLLDDTVSPVPASAAAVTEPSGSSAWAPEARQSVGSAAGTRESLLLGLGQAAGISEREPKITPSS